MGAYKMSKGVVRTYKLYWLKKIISCITCLAFIVSSISTDFFSYNANANDAITINPNGVKHLSIETFQLPMNLGIVRDSWSSPNGNNNEKDRIVVHIQDAHCNYGCQKKISEIIEFLHKEYGFETVNLEGGAKDYDLSLFTDINDTSLREKAADHFVKAGLVNGAEYFTINNPEKTYLWGVEDADLYIDNLKIYRESFQYKGFIDEQINTLDRILAVLKGKIYSNDLLKFDNNYSRYKSGNLDFKDYLSYLISAAKDKGIDIKPFENISLLCETLAEEGSIDFKKANIERDMLIDQLRNKLSETALEEFVKKTLLFRSEQITLKEYYDYLSERAKFAGFSLDNFSELKKYMAYTAKYSSIDKMNIMSEIESLETKIKDALFENDSQKELSGLSKNLALLRNIFSLQLTKDDFKFYKSNESSFAVSHFLSFADKFKNVLEGSDKPKSDITRLDGYRKRMAKFFDYSFKRDEAFVRNMEYQTIEPEDVPDENEQNSGMERAIIVTGGFHTENLCEMFRGKGISYISIMPSFTNCDGYECPYFSILSGRKSIKIADELPSVLKNAMQVTSQFTELYPQVQDQLGNMPDISAIPEQDISEKGSQKPRGRAPGGTAFSFIGPALFAAGAGIRDGAAPDFLGLGASTYLTIGIVLTALSLILYFIVPLILRVMEKRKDIEEPYYEDDNEPYFDVGLFISGRQEPDSDSDAGVAEVENQDVPEILSEDFREGIESVFKKNADKIKYYARGLIKAGFSEERIKAYTLDEVPKRLIIPHLDIMMRAARIAGSDIFKEAVKAEEARENSDVSGLMELVALKIPFHIENNHTGIIAEAACKMRNEGLSIESVKGFILGRMMTGTDVIANILADNIINIVNAGCISSAVEMGIDRFTAVNLLLIDIPKTCGFRSYDAATRFIKLIHPEACKDLNMTRPDQIKFCMDMILVYGETIEFVVKKVFIPMTKLGLDIDTVKEYFLKELPKKWKGSDLNAAINAIWNIMNDILDEFINATQMDRIEASKLLLMALPKKYGLSTFNAAKKLQKILTTEKTLTAEQIKMLINRFPENENNIDTAIAVYKRILTKGYTVPRQRVLQFLDSKDGERCLDVMLLDDMHKDVFANYIEPFLDTLNEEEKAAFINTILVEVGGTKGVDSIGLVTHQRLWNTIAVLQHLEVSECAFIGRFIEDQARLMEKHFPLDNDARGLIEIIKETRPAEFVSAELLKNSLISRAVSLGQVSDMIKSISVIDDRTGDQMSPQSFLGIVIKNGIKIPAMEKLAEALASENVGNWKTVHDLKIQIATRFNVMNLDTLASSVGKISVIGGSWKNNIENAMVNDPAFKELRETLFRGNNGKPTYFDSWKNFERLQVLANMIAQKEVLQALDEKCKKKEAKCKTEQDRKDAETIREYYRRLILHSEMKDFPALKKMIMYPRQFLELDDPNSPVEIHKVKKPSALLDIGYMDIDAEELIDGFILGRLNAFQAIEPFEYGITDLELAMGCDNELQRKDENGKYVLRGIKLIKYLRSKGYVSEDDLRSMLMEHYADIQKKDNVRKLLFPGDRSKYLPAIVRSGIDSIVETLKDKSKTLESKAMRKAQFDIEALMARVSFCKPHYKIRIIAKSEPQAIMTGSEVPTCMKYGSGKNNIYMFNPNTAVMALSEEVTDNGITRDRILATSVITLNRRVPKNVSLLRKEYEEKGPGELDMVKLFGENFVDEVSGDVYVAADNIEVLPNAMDRFLGDISFNDLVKTGYKRFFEEFFKRHNGSRPRDVRDGKGRESLMSRPFNMTKLIVGRSYTKVDGLPQEDNFYLPQAPLAYSDNSEEKSLFINVDAPQSVEAGYPTYNGVAPLSYEDTLEVAYIENVAFKDKPGFKSHLAGIEMELVAATYNEALKGIARKNLSFGYFKEGKLLGYIIAYVGIDKRTGEEFIYVSDFASLHGLKNAKKSREGALAAGFIMRRFSEAVKDVAKFYKDNFNKDLRILFQATTGDTGSYRMMDDERLTKYGMTKMSENDMGDGRVEVWLRVGTEPIENAEVTGEPAAVIGEPVEVKGVKNEAGQTLLAVNELEPATARTKWNKWIDMMNEIDKNILSHSEHKIFDGGKCMVNIPLSEEFTGKSFAEFQSAATNVKSELNNLIVTRELGNIKINFFRDNAEGREALKGVIDGSGIAESDRTNRIITFAYQKDLDKDAKLESQSYVVYLTGELNKTATPIGTCGMAGLAYLQYNDLKGRESKDKVAINNAVEQFIMALAIMSGAPISQDTLNELAAMDEKTGIRNLIASGLILVKIRPIDTNEIKQFHESEAEVLRAL